MAIPVGVHHAALAFAGMWNVDDEHVRTRLAELTALNATLLEE
jgi:hypothetical protein